MTARRSGIVHPDVTVVIPTRNRWSRLSVALTVALCQEDVDVEVIVVDDGSSDETPAALASLKEPRLRICRHDVQHGTARARNAGINAAQGTWLAFLDDDDLWSPHKLRSQLDVAEPCDASFVYTAAAHIDESKKVVGMIPAPEPRRVLRLLLRGNVHTGRRFWRNSEDGARAPGWRLR